MRIMGTGDLHGDRSLAEKLAEKAEQEHVDIVVIAGDFTFFDQEPKGVLGAFAKRKQKVLLIPGNHDSHATTDVLTQTYPVRNLHGYSARYGDIGFFGCGKANLGPEHLTEREITDTLKKAHQHIAYLKKRIMVTHVHPAGILAERMSLFIPASSGVRKAIEDLQPDIALCSHVHEAEGLEDNIGKTRVLNVGARGQIFDL